MFNVIEIIPQNTQNSQSPRWLNLLYARGFTDTAITRAGLRPHQHGWAYPIHPTISAQRVKAFPDQQGPKYQWKPNKPDNARFYDPAGDLAEHVAAAGGVLILASGEADVWACWSAGIYNVTCTLHGEGTLPPWLIAELHALKVQTVNIWPDRDQAGTRHAAKLRAALAESGITLNAYTLPFEMGSKGDLNTLLLDAGAEQFRTALDHCPPLELPAEQETPPRIQRENVPGAFKDLYERWCVEVVERAAIRTWAIPPANGKGLSHHNFSSPLREDHHPSAQWSYTAHGFKDYGTGEFYNTHAVAALLGVPTWDDFKREYTIRRLTRKPTPLAETIQPVSLPDFEAHHVVRLRYVSELPTDTVLNHRAVLVKSPVGTGKTELVKRLIATLDRNGTANVLVVTHRQALAADIAARLGLDCYKTIPDDRLVQAHRLVITYNSLHKISASERQWDLVVIDEIEQFHQHLFGETFRGGEAHRAHSALTSILNRARHFVGLDAHLTGISALWTHRTLNAAPYLIHNTYQYAWGELTLHAQEDSVVAAALTAAQQQRGPVVITTSSRQRAEVYFRLVCETIGPDDVRLVTGENSSSADTQRFIDRINTELPNLRVLICTPSFGTGLDVTARVYGVFGVMLNRPLVATDMIQMIGRFRHAEQRHVYVQPLHQGEPVDWLTRWGEALQADFDTRRAAEFAPFGIGPLPVSQHDILMLAAKLTSAADLQKTDLLSYFAAYAQAEGFTLAYRDGEHRPTRDMIRATRQTLAEERKTRTLDAVPVSHDEYERYQEAGQISPEIVAGYQRWKIENTVGLSITGTIYDDLHTPTNRAALRRLADLITDTELLKARDRQEAREQVLLVQRGHYTTTQSLIFSGLSAVFGTDFLTANAILTEQDITARLAPWLAERAEQVDRLIGSRRGLSQQPLFVLRRLLAAIGLKLAKDRVMIDGERFMRYRLEEKTRDRWLAYAHARLVHLAALERFTTNRREELAFTDRGKNSGSGPEGAVGDLPYLDIVRGRVKGGCSPGAKPAW